MIMKIKLLSLCLFTLLAFSSCGYLFREIITPNRCKKCEIFDQNNNVVWFEDECGGELYNMELRAKATAYDYGCNHTLKCDSYKKNK